MALLEVTDLVKRFGGLVANDHISMVVNQGTIVGLIGPNGAGKTTLFNCITNRYPADNGVVKLQGRDITHLSPEEICRSGLVRTFQVMRTFSGMTALENVTVGALCRTSRVRDARKDAIKVLEFTGLLEKRDVLASDLTVLDRKRIELARALATQPTLLLLDEVLAGLTPTETAEAVRLVRGVREQGITVFMVEHVMEVIMPISDRVVVLNCGRKIAEGVPADIAKNEEVIDAYLGRKYRA